MPFARSWTFAAAALVVALAAAVSVPHAAAQAAAPTAPAAPPPTRIATINIVNVFNSLNQKKDGDREIELLAQDLTKQRTAKEDEVKALQQELKEAYNPDSAIYKETQDKLLLKAMELSAFQQYMEQKVTLEQRSRTIVIYRAINDAIKTYAQANGIALVLVADDADLSDARTPGELLSRITVRKVIYAVPELDITAAIIDRMNTDYKLHAPKS